MISHGTGIRSISSLPAAPVLPAPVKPAPERHPSPTPDPEPDPATAPRPTPLREPGEDPHTTPIEPVCPISPGRGASTVTINFSGIKFSALTFDGNDQEEES